MTQGKLVNMAELAGLLNKSPTTIASWVKRGLPYVRKADRRKQLDWQFSVPQVVGWLLEREVVGDDDSENVTTSELERRKLAAETKIKEFDAAKKRGELGSIAEFQRQVTDLAIKIRHRMLQIPRRHEPHDSKRRRDLEDEVIDALTDISEKFGTPPSEVTKYE